MNKKAELSINMIIMAIIAIVILVILIFLITGVFRDTNRETGCSKNGGICVEGYKCNDPLIGSDKPITCSDATLTCCRPGGMI
jgi:hypothetical protein